MFAGSVSMGLRSEPRAIATIHAASDEEAAHLGELGRNREARHQFPVRFVLVMPSLSRSMAY